MNRPRDFKGKFKVGFRSTARDDNYARHKLHTELESGRIKKPDYCEKCGRKEEFTKNGKSKLHAHHTDYKNPLKVEWLCVSCHMLATPLPRGEKHHYSKLTQKQVDEMLKLRSEGITYPKLAEMFEVTQGTIGRIVRGETWCDSVKRCPTCNAPWGGGAQ